MKTVFISIISSLLFTLNAHTQTIIIDPQVSNESVPEIYKPGIFLVPRNPEGTNDFLSNGIHYNSIRTIGIELALNHWAVSSIDDVMAELEAQKSNIMLADSRCDKLILPILKMPLWLSSSTDETLVEPGFTVFNAKPPASYQTWNILMDSIVSKFNDQWGLDPYYEIWNEPDVGYWQGTTEEYFTFFRNTYMGLKGNHPSARVGGPTVSSFKSQFTRTLPSGNLTSTQFDSTIIAMVIDSCMSWGTPLDFISWHKFGLNLDVLDMEIDHLNQKLIESGHGPVPYIVSEWNLSSSLRESPISAAYMINYTQALQEHNIDGQMVAAWQDFTMDGNDNSEFHQDYGLLSWGGLHKPAWKALRLLDKLEGAKLNVDNSDYKNLAVNASYNNDTLKVLVSNYALPGTVVATFSLYYDHGINSFDLMTNGYDAPKLDSIYRGLIAVPGNDALTSSINSVIPTYQTAEDLFQHGRNINLTISGLSGTHTGKKITIDSTHNNVIYRYDSLIANGYTRTDAVNSLYPNDFLDSENIIIYDSTYSFDLQSNGVVFIELYMPEVVLSLNDLTFGDRPSLVYPNPTDDIVHINVPDQTIQHIAIYDQNGHLVKMVKDSEFSVRQFTKGVYLLVIQTDRDYYSKRLVKE